jgi:hypothetical protein
MRRTEIRPIWDMRKHPVRAREIEEEGVLRLNMILKLPEVKGDTLHRGRRLTTSVDLAAMPIRLDQAEWDVEAVP